MLGRIRAERRWQWAISGKHPAAKDYFTLGDTFPLSKAFSEWMARGYDLFDRGRPFGGYSWRFWTREARNDHVVCGVLKDSNDGIGRPYPLLIIGTGQLPDWRQRWDLIPFACEPTWLHIEYLSTKSFPDIRALSAEIGAIRQPTIDWDHFANESTRFREFPMEALKERLLNLPENEPFLRLESEHYEVPELIGLCHMIVRSHLKELPNVIFMGGTAEHNYFGLFRRALSTADFVRMWSLRR